MFFESHSSIKFIFQNTYKYFIDNKNILLNIVTNKFRNKSWYIYLHL